MSKVIKSERVYIRDLNVNDRFSLPGKGSVYVCQRRVSGVGGTLVEYRLEGSNITAYFTRPGLTLVDRF